MSGPSNDITILRALASRYAEIAADPVQQERRDLWTRHNSLEKTRTPIIIVTGFWDMWCREFFADSKMQCADPFYRSYEKQMRFDILHAEWGDDCVFEPWITVGAVQPRGWGNVWGVELKHESLPQDGAAWRFDPVLKDLTDLGLLSWPPHQIDEVATAENIRKLEDAIGDILPVHCERGPVCQGFMADISTHLAQLRGMEQLMFDMMESPDELHRLLAWMRDGILANQQAAEEAGDIAQTSQQNQCMALARETLPPKPATLGAKRQDLWAFGASQEFTGVSPAMQDEFLLEYQKPILEKWRLCAYGCCEDLTRKIDILRRLKNLRIIAVAPLANLRQCAEQVGTEYVLSWRPNPSQMVTCGFDEGQIRRILADQLRDVRDCHVHINLKDVYTLEGDVGRLRRWTQITREVINQIAG